MTAAVAWWTETGVAVEAADRVEARTLGLETTNQRPNAEFYLARDDSVLTLFRAAERGRDASVSVDLAASAGRRGTSRHTSLLARACGLHRRPGLSIFDATAGLGRDSAVLAGLGCTVTAFERHPVPAALVRDALARAKSTGMFGARWTQVHFADARDYLTNDIDDAPDVVLIDPMFNAPKRQAKAQKHIAWLAEIMGADENADKLVSAARAVAGRRVVVKRHARQPSFETPDLTFGQRAIRFDVYLRR